MKRTLFKIKNNTIDSIKDQLNELTRQYHRKFCNNILDIIHEQIRGIPEYKIEDLIQDELTNKIKIRDINTEIVQTDQTIIPKATFANIWLSSSGINHTPGDVRFGETQAFSSEAKKIIRYHL